MMSTPIHGGDDDRPRDARRGRGGALAWVKDRTGLQAFNPVRVRVHIDNNGLVSQVPAIG
jgi:hypothetical protein